MQALNALQLEYDARALAAACLSKAAFLYSNLRRMGHETPSSTVDIFGYALKQALSDDGPQAKVQTEQGHIVDPNKKN